MGPQTRVSLVQTTVMRGTGFVFLANFCNQQSRLHMCLMMHMCQLQLMLINYSNKSPLDNLICLTWFKYIYVSMVRSLTHLSCFASLCMIHPLLATISQLVNPPLSNDSGGIICSCTKTLSSWGA